MHPPPINYTKMGQNLNRDHILFLTGFDFLNQKSDIKPKKKLNQSHSNHNRETWINTNQNLKSSPM